MRRNNITLPTHNFLLFYILVILTTNKKKFSSKICSILPTNQKVSLNDEALEFGFWHYVQIVHTEALASIVFNSLSAVVHFIGLFFRAHGPFFFGILTSGPKTLRDRFSDWTLPTLRGAAGLGQGSEIGKSTVKLQGQSDDCLQIAS